MKTGPQRTTDFFEVVTASERGYDDAVLAFEKLCAQHGAQGQDVHALLQRAYESCKSRGILGALINRDGEFWIEEMTRRKLPKCCRCNQVIRDAEFMQEGDAVRHVNACPPARGTR
jgi:hypothetical protein